MTRATCSDCGDRLTHPEASEVVMTTYRVTSPWHRLHGVVVNADDVCGCDECDETGQVIQYGRRRADSPLETRLAACPACGGSGHVLGYTSWGEPVRVVLVEDISRTDVRPALPPEGAAGAASRGVRPGSLIPSR